MNKEDKELTAEQWLRKDGIIFSDQNIKLISDSMRTYAQQLLSKKLKEQRELCATAWAEELENDADAIRNAPEPK